MEVGEGIHVVPEGMVDMQGDVGECERVFELGELVEFWAGPVVRAYRTDSGAGAAARAGRAARRACVCERDTVVRVVWDKNGGKLRGEEQTSFL